MIFIELKFILQHFFIF